MYLALRYGVVENALIIGGSNARDLAYATFSLVVETYKLATGGWKLSRESLDKLIPDLKELLSSLPSKTPVISFCLDNSRFLAASEEGGLFPFSKGVPEDNGYHVADTLVVARERGMQQAIVQLWRAIAGCGDFRSSLSSLGQDMSHNHGMQVMLQTFRIRIFSLTFYWTNRSSSWSAGRTAQWRIRSRR
jgi:hypothetical protein